MVSLTLIPVMNQSVIEQLPNWLTLLSTIVLGCVTSYFAWKSRQLERRQAQQINREFERELADVELELNAGSHLLPSWIDWKAKSGILPPLEVYRISREAKFGPPNLTKVKRALAFHLPEMEEVASDAIIKISVAFGILDLLIAPNAAWSPDQQRRHIAGAEEAMREGDEKLQVVLGAVREHRRRLRDGFA